MKLYFFLDLYSSSFAEDENNIPHYIRKLILVTREWIYDNNELYFDSIVLLLYLWNYGDNPNKSFSDGCGFQLRVNSIAESVC